MNFSRRVLHATTMVLNGFLGLTAVIGGIALLAGVVAMPVELLQGSVFRSYTVPGLSLLVVVGGGAALAVVLLARKSPFALLASISSGVIIMSFEFVEIMVIGSPPGPALFLQAFYYALGLVIVIASLALWLTETLAATA